MLVCLLLFFVLMMRRPPGATRTDTSCPARRSSDLLVDLGEDLPHAVGGGARDGTVGEGGDRLAQGVERVALAVLLDVEIGQLAQQSDFEEVAAPGEAQEIGRASCRERVCQYE